MKSNQKAKKSYHHGDLHQSLLTTATKMLNEQGIDSLSLRKIAENVGVSRTAAYHHFTDKNDLLCAIAAQGFTQWQQQAEKVLSDKTLSKSDHYRAFVYNYIDFATANANLYDLMFGRTIWKDQGSNETLRQAAYPTFDYQVKITKHWQDIGLFPQTESSLRLAQVIWGTLHGIARLTIDGIYKDNTSIEEMCECAVNLFLANQPH
ncbi:TetR/AcrR family transcriptional regulator [Thalassotalea sp. G2M2-11]|uniref:TetR/AcrR family transcriptional regulator n=1 Tax=Thalassotalea sp. G2M2-11 TaxID=2787627 RepID=UPI0019D1E848|nr:TetR/AcrR family transcriptional regulator [Thalassotalea sp. G2M2-11]